MLFILNSSITKYHYGVYNFYPTHLPSYKIKTIDLDFNTCKKFSKKRQSKGLGKQLKKAVSNHYYSKIKKNVKQAKP
jgi:hypothetical protein